MYAKHANAHISKLQDGVFKAMLKEKLEKIIQTKSEEKLSKYQTSNKSPLKKINVHVVVNPIHKLLALLLQYRNLALEEKYLNKLIQVNLNGVEIVLKLVE